MTKRVTYGQLRRVLVELGFRESRRADGVALEHRPSDTLFLFRPYSTDDKIQPAEVQLVTKQLDERGCWNQIPLKSCSPRRQRRSRRE